MFDSAQHMIDWCKDGMTALAKDPAFGSMTAVYEAVSRLSGLSVSLLMKFMQGQRDNPSAESLDKMIGALEKLGRKAAA